MMNLMHLIFLTILFNLAWSEASTSPKTLGLLNSSSKSNMKPHLWDDCPVRSWLTCLTRCVSNSCETGKVKMLIDLKTVEKKKLCFCARLYNAGDLNRLRDDKCWDHLQYQRCFDRDRIGCELQYICYDKTEMCKFKGDQHKCFSVNFYLYNLPNITGKEYVCMFLVEKYYVAPSHDLNKTEVQKHRLDENEILYFHVNNENYLNIYDILYNNTTENSIMAKKSSIADEKFKENKSNKKGVTDAQEEIRQKIQDPPKFSLTTSLNGVLVFGEVLVEAAERGETSYKFGNTTLKLTPEVLKEGKKRREEKLKRKECL